MSGSTVPLCPKAASSDSVCLTLSHRARWQAPKLSSDICAQRCTPHSPNCGAAPLEKPCRLAGHVNAFAIRLQNELWICKRIMMSEIAIVVATPRRAMCLPRAAPDADTPHTSRSIHPMTGYLSIGSVPSGFAHWTHVLRPPVRTGSSHQRNLGRIRSHARLQVFETSRKARESCCTCQSCRMLHDTYMLHCRCSQILLQQQRHKSAHECCLASRTPSYSILLAVRILVAILCIIYLYTATLVVAEAI